MYVGEGNGNPLQYSCLKNPMDRGAWWAAVHGVARSQTRLSNWLHFHFSLPCIEGGNGNPLQCSCLENPRNGGAWWAAIYGFTQSRMRLKWLSSSSSSMYIYIYISTPPPPSLFSGFVVQRGSLQVFSTHCSSGGIQIGERLCLPPWKPKRPWILSLLLVEHGLWSEHWQAGDSALESLVWIDSCIGVGSNRHCSWQLGKI